MDRGWVTSVMVLSVLGGLGQRLSSEKLRWSRWCQKYVSKIWLLPKTFASFSDLLTWPLMVLLFRGLIGASGSGPFIYIYIRIWCRLPLLLTLPVFTVQLSTFFRDCTYVLCRGWQVKSTAFRLDRWISDSPLCCSFPSSLFSHVTQPNLSAFGVFKA